MIYFTTKEDHIAHGTVFLRVQAREVPEDTLRGTGRLIAEATFVMDPRLGSVLGSAIVEERAYCPPETMEELRARAQAAADSWKAA